LDFCFAAIWTPLILLPQRGEGNVFCRDVKVTLDNFVKLGRRKTDWKKNGIVKVSILSLDGRGQR
jgi:hypothetical protein